MKSRVVICVFFALAFGHAAAFSEFEVCSNCYTTSQFAYAAEQYSLNTRPGFIGVDPVYVANPESGTVRFFDVHRSQDWDFDPHGGPGDRGSARPADSGTLGDPFFVAEAVEAAGDPATIQVIEDGAATLYAVLDLLLGQVINAQDVDGLDDLGSAVALLGPEPSQVRLRVQRRLNAHFNSMQNSVISVVSDAVVGAYRNFLSDSDLMDGPGIRLVFPDGTFIDIKISVVYISGSLDDSWQFELMLHTVDGPGLEDGAPQSQEWFGDYTYQGPYATAWEILKLAQRYGIPIGSGGSCSMECADTCVVSCSGY